MKGAASLASLWLLGKDQVSVLISPPRKPLPRLSACLGSNAASRQSEQGTVPWFGMLTAQMMLLNLHNDPYLLGPRFGGSDSPRRRRGPPWGWPWRNCQPRADCHWCLGRTSSPCPSSAGHSVRVCPGVPHPHQVFMVEQPFCPPEVATSHAPPWLRVLHPPEEPWTLLGAG